MTSTIIPNFNSDFKAGDNPALSPDPSESIAIEIQDLQKRLGDREAVAGVSLQVRSGEIFGLLGPNGAGKTTTLRCLCTLTQADAGRVKVAGLSVNDHPRAVRQKLGYVAQELALDKMLTGRELLQLHADLYHLPRSVARSRIEELLTVLDLQDYGDRLIGTYSGGLKKRLDLAAGLVHEPEILILDEPTTGLDLESRAVMWQMIRNLRQQGKTILLTSHYLEEIDALCDRLAILDRGRVISSGTPQELKSQVGGERITLRIREFTPDAEAQQVRSQLLQLPYIRSVTIHASQGNALHLMVDAPTLDSHDILSLVQAQIASKNPLFGIARSQPSLEDVYLTATGKMLGDPCQI